MTSQELSDAVTGLGWRYVLNAARTSVPVPDLATGVAVVSLAVGACGPDLPLSVDLRARHVALALDAVPDLVGAVERITAALRAAGHTPAPGAGGHAVQALEVAIDALDIPAVLPFWRAVLGYVPTGDRDLVDPAGLGPAVWFQEMDAPRPQRNRIHLDVSVSHDEAPSRIAAAVAAGGRVMSDVHAPMFWVLADPEGNEACVSTWQGRD